MFDGGVRSANARALTTVHLIAVEFDDVRDVLVHRPEVLWAVVRILARRLRATDEALADAMFLDVTGRTAKRLLELADGEDDFRMPLTQEELAGMVGASRERVNKAIALFVKLGWLEISGRSRYRIVNREELEIRARSHSSSCSLRDEPDPASRRSRSLTLERLAQPRPVERAGPSSSRRVFGAVDVAVGVVDEAVLGAFDHDDLAVGPAAPRGAQRLDVGGGRPRVVRAEERERRAHLGGDVERLDAMARARASRRACAACRRTRPRRRSGRRDAALNA